MESHGLCGGKFIARATVGVIAITYMYSLGYYLGHVLAGGAIVNPRSCRPLGHTTWILKQKYCGVV